MMCRRGSLGARCFHRRGLLLLSGLVIAFVALYRFHLTEVNFGDNFLFVTRWTGRCWWWTPRCALPAAGGARMNLACTMMPCCRAKALSVLRWLDNVLAAAGFEYVVEGGMLA